ncbi:MAG: OsmC family protein [Candidatus Lokiarchaeota archaeon]|nr:OsmC family protein [Candidatus Lokiarchaeota archaeon]
MKVHINLSENLHFIASTRHFNKIHIDEPEAFHGTDKGPSSVEYILIGVGGCLGSTFAFCLQKRKIKPNSLEIVVEGKLKQISPERHLRLKNINCEIYISIDENQYDLLDECIGTFQKHCVVSQSIISGIPINIDVLKR